MGLDIYFHTTKRNTNLETSEQVGELFENVDNDAKEELSVAYDEFIATLSKCKKESSYNRKYEAGIKKLAKLSSYPQFLLGKLGMRYDYSKGKDYLETIVPLGTVITERDIIIKGHYKKDDGYFRKVNFIFAFFEPKMIDKFYAEVTVEDIDTLLKKCHDVLDHKDDTKYAAQTLPTQSGRFFGSTDYDKWYYYDVKVAIKVLTKYRKKLVEENLNGYVYFSW